VGDCGQTVDQLTVTNKGIPIPQDSLDAFHGACRWHTKIFYGYAIAGVGAVAAVVSLIMLTRDPVASDSHVAGARPRSGVTIAPLIAPDRAGAQITVRW
jgi:hypothetical protein